MDMAGLGTVSLRLIGRDQDHRIDLAQLGAAVQRDRDAAVGALAMLSSRYGPLLGLGLP